MCSWHQQLSRNKRVLFRFRVIFQKVIWKSKQHSSSLTERATLSFQWQWLFSLQLCMSFGIDYWYELGFVYCWTSPCSKSSHYFIDWYSRGTRLYVCTFIWQRYTLPGPSSLSSSSSAMADLSLSCNTAVSSGCGVLVSTVSFLSLYSNLNIRRSEAITWRRQAMTKLKRMYKTWQEMTRFEQESKKNRQEKNNKPDRNMDELTWIRKLQGTGKWKKEADEGGEVNNSVWWVSHGDSSFELLVEVSLSCTGRFQSDGYLNMTPRI